MKALLTSFESIMRLVTFYFLISVQGKSISLLEAILGIYLLLILQKASRTLSEIVKLHYNFEEACTRITEFLSLTEIDFETVDVEERNIHKNPDGIVQSLLWEEQSVKLGNDFLYNADDNDQTEYDFNADKMS